MAIIVPRKEEIFFHRKVLKLFNENYSPALLQKISYAGTQASSFANAQDYLQVLGDISVSASHIQRLTIRIGKEFAYQEDEAARVWDETSHQDNKPVEVTSISIDGGRAQIRKEPSSPGAHDPVWTETKVACLQTLRSQEHTEDPHPILPRVFTNKNTVENLVVGLKGHQKSSNAQSNLSEQTAPSSKDDQSVQDKKEYGPEIVNRVAVATVDTADAFGNLVFHKSHQYQLHTAQRKAYLGDGDIKLWSIYDDYFKHEGWCPILDFVHAIEYVFEAAKISTTNEQSCWAKYIEFATHLWQGRPLTVIRRLDKTIDAFASSNTNSSKTIHDKLVSIRKYFKNNYTKMNYPEYRMKGLPVSSCHVESLIKQFNRRVKSTEKFWNKSSLRGMLSIKAAYLSQNDSVTQFWNNRYDWQINSKRSYLKMAA